MTLPPVQPKSRVTPLDMGGDDADVSSDLVLNILRLLQTLDEDGDPENGITINQHTALALSDTVLDFSAATFEEEAAVAVNTAVGRPLTSPNDAIAHFQSALASDLVGSWVYIEDNGGINVLTILDSQHYTIAHSHEFEDQPAGSVEFGTYNWDPISGEFAITGIIRENDADGGLYNADNPVQEPLHVRLIDGNLVMAFGGDEGEGIFKPAASFDSPLAGSWTSTFEAGNSYATLVFSPHAVCFGANR